MTSPSPNPSSCSPLVVRLRNWVGDVVLCVPTLRRLEAGGHELHLIGKGWAADLLGGYGWRVERVASGQWERVAQIRELRRRLGPEARAIVFPYAFSSALEFRLAGLPATGFAGQCRGCLLRRSVNRPTGLRTGAEYWRLGQAFLGLDEPRPAFSEWRLSAASETQAQDLVARHGLGSGFVVLIPFASNGPDDARVWPEFPRLAERLSAEGLRVVLCPGSPAETAASRERYSSALVLPGVGMSAYGALMRRARAVVACDTGPGHLAGAAGARLISLFGPSDPAVWGPEGPQVEILRAWPAWPSLEEVLRRVRSPNRP